MNVRGGSGVSCAVRHCVVGDVVVVVEVKGVVWSCVA